MAAGKTNGNKGVKNPDRRNGKAFKKKLVDLKGRLAKRTPERLIKDHEIRVAREKRRAENIAKAAALKAAQAEIDEHVKGMQLNGVTA